MYQTPKHRFIIILTILALFVLGSFASYQAFAQSEDSASAAPASVTTTAVGLSHSDRDGLQFTLDTPRFTQSGTAVAIDGLSSNIATAGAPALPYYATTILLPPNATASVVVEERKSLTAFVGELAPALTPDYAATQTAVDGITRLLPPLVAQPDAAIYTTNALYPALSYELTEPMMARDLRLVELRLYPLRYNPTSGQVTQAQHLQVTITFDNAQWNNLQPLHDTTPNPVADGALNAAQAANWRSLPSDPLYTPPAVPLPIGVDTYKIAINQDGIYEVTYADLAAAGMAVNSVNPLTFQMMAGGNPVAYQFIGDNDTTFEPGEKVRFYGWKFNGRRTEKQFIANNIVWLWAGGTPATIATASNTAGQGNPIATNYPASLTTEPENSFFATWTVWDNFPNEPDAWYWDYISTSGTPVNVNYTVNLPDPDPSGTAVTTVAEFFSRITLTAQNPHLVHTTFNNDPTMATGTWYGLRSVNITNTLPSTAILDGANTFHVEVASPVDQLYLNRITVDYLRQLKAVNNQLFFNPASPTATEFRIGRFSENNPANVLVWDVTNPQQPVQIQMNAGNISGSAGDYTYAVGRTPAANAQILATTASNILSPVAISQYIPPSIEPPNSRADWLAITHINFYSAALTLADHRANVSFGAFQTYVVDQADIINQYGFGLPLPAAIHDYLAHALQDWDIAPRYVLMMGDATQNPRNLACQETCSTWDPNAPTYLITDLVFEDPFQGLIPSDFPFVLLSGDDLIPDMAIGRIAADTLAEANNAVDKIITYDQNQFEPANIAWQKNFLFVADDTDSGGDFCAENATTSANLPTDFHQDHLCLPTPPTTVNTNALIYTMSQHINNEGISILNYRGHGGINRWAGGSSGSILSTGAMGFWQNPEQPVVILSADCLDGHFAWPGLPALSEQILKLQTTGSAAHWSSTGLGYTFQHTILHAGFYNGAFRKGLPAVGDAANYGKYLYLLSGNFESELYSFTLQGDPAMQLFRPKVSVTKESLDTVVQANDPVSFRLTVSNEGLYPDRVSLVDTLPGSLQYLNSTTTAPVTITTNGNLITYTLANALSISQTVVITVNTSVYTGYAGLQTNLVDAVSGALDLTPYDQSATSNFTILNPNISLISFEATPLDNAVQLDWESLSETDITGFRLQRRMDNGLYMWLNNVGNGGVITATGSPGATYSVVDNTALNGHTYVYKLFTVSADASLLEVALRQVALITPSTILAQFNPLPMNNAVQLNWVTTSEADTAAFRIERSHNGGPFVWLPLGQSGYITAVGNPGASYSLMDSTALNGETYTYRLIASQSTQSNSLEQQLDEKSVTLMDITLASLTTTPLDNAAQINWTTSSEFATAAFILERGQGGVYTWLTDLGNNGYIPATGGVGVSTNYQMVDSGALNGETYTYRLSAVTAANAASPRRILATSTVTLPGVNIATFTASPLNNAVSLHWDTLGEVGVSSFVIERGQNGNFIWLTGLGSGGYVAATGPNGASYNAVDTTAVNGQTYTYRLVALYTPDINSTHIDLSEQDVTLMDVTLASLSGTPGDNQVVLDWTTSQEIATAAFIIERGQNGTYTWLTDLGNNGYITATGGTMTTTYTVTDTTAVNGQTYDYRLTAVHQPDPTATRLLLDEISVTLPEIGPTYTIFLPIALKQ